MQQVGDILRTEREKQGRTLAGIAEELCIMGDYVRALENGDVKSLPGTFFYKSFTRQYAAILQLDEQLILPQLAELSSAEEATASPAVRVPDPLVEVTNRLHFPDVPLGWSVFGLAGVLTVCSIFYAWWNQPRPVPASAARVQQSAPAVPVPAIPVQAVPVQDVSLNSADADAASGVVLKLSATERTWLSIRSGGREVFSGVLQPNESKTLTGLDMATMKVGNAGGIEIRWNGKPIGPLGTSGQVLTVRFTPEDFEIVPPPPKQEL
jgi:cytoskeletal protein RodZ